MSALPNRSAEPRMSGYDAEVAGFRLEVPEVFNPVIDIVEKWAAEAPDDLALVSLDGEGGTVAEQTVADLALESRRAARALLDAGVKKGDRVFIMLPRVPAWYTAMLGAIRPSHDEWLAALGEALPQLPSDERAATEPLIELFRDGKLKGDDLKAFNRLLNRLGRRSPAVAR